jgi:antitoxin (DNA-binding transcriptional repressor) of toxin-antitoxin stability system
MTVSIEQAQISLGELVERSARGERIVITRGQVPVAELRAVSAGGCKPVFGACKGMLKVISEDDEHLRDFAEYME